jgi:integrase
MARSARPWYSAEKHCYMAHIKGKKVRLLKGEQNPTNHKKAEQTLRQLLKSKEKDPTTKSGITVAEVIELYLKLNQSKYSERAFEERRRYLQLFAELHGLRKVNEQDCSPIHLEQWLHDNPQWASDWTKSQVVNIVQRPFNWAAKKRIIPSNPFRGVEVQSGKPRRPLTDKEFQELLRAVASQRKKAKARYPSGRKVCPSDRKRRQRPSPAARFRQVLVFLKFTGARPGELGNLAWDDIDLEGKVITLKSHKTSKKTGKPRVIPIHPVVLKLLIFIKRLGQPGNRVFLTPRKSPWTRNSLAKRLVRAREVAGIPPDAKLYGLRHRFGTTAVLRGVDIKTLAELMGHTSTRTTEHYLHLAGQRQHLADAMLRANAPDPGS